MSFIVMGPDAVWNVVIQRQSGHRQDRQELVSVTFERVWAVVWMSSAAMTSFFEPVLAVVHWSGRDPVDGWHDFAVVTDIKVLTQRQKPVHNLPWSVLVR